MQEADWIKFATDIKRIIKDTNKIIQEVDDLRNLVDPHNQQLGTLLDMVVFEINEGQYLLRELVEESAHDDNISKIPMSREDFISSLEDDDFRQFGDVENPIVDDDD